MLRAEGLGLAAVAARQQALEMAASPARMPSTWSNQTILAWGPASVPRAEALAQRLPALTHLAWCPWQSPHASARRTIDVLGRAVACSCRRPSALLCRHRVSSSRIARDSDLPLLVIFLLFLANSCGFLFLVPPAVAFAAIAIEIFHRFVIDMCMCMFVGSCPVIVCARCFVSPSSCALIAASACAPSRVAPTRTARGKGVAKRWQRRRQVFEVVLWRSPIALSGGWIPCDIHRGARRTSVESHAAKGRQLRRAPVIVARS